MVMHGLVAAGGAVSPLVGDLGMCFVASALFSVIFERLRIPTIAALLGAGVLIGPEGLSVVQSQANIETIANLGLTLLLFVIGLEIHPSHLLANGRILIVTGLLQVPLTIGGLAAAFQTVAWLGGPVPDGPYTPLYFGAVCAFSSTLLVVKLLQDRLEIDSLSGRLCVGLLIFQDIWAIVFLAVQPSFEHPQIAPIGLTFVGIGIVAGVAWLVARVLLPKAFRVVAKSPELLITLGLGWCFGLALLGAHLGDALALAGVEVELSVSMEMGALIAGASLATSPYAHEMVVKVGNLRDFFVTLFFVGLGMSIPVPRTLDPVLAAVVLSTIAVGVRYLLFFPLLYWSGLDRRFALETSTKLAQISEFCLVIAYLGAQFGHLDRELVSTIIFAFVFTALTTPTLFAMTDRIYQRVTPLLSLLGFKSPAPEGGVADQDTGDPRIIVLGFHRIAAALMHDLATSHPEIMKHTLVVDINVSIHDRIRQLGAHVVYGDISNPSALLHVGLAHAELILSTIPDELLKNTSNLEITQAVRKLNPQAIIVAHSTRISDVEGLLAAGANDVFVTPVETAAAIYPAVVAALNGTLEGYLQSRELIHGSLRARQHVLD